MIDNQNVGKTIAAFRQARGLSQQGLANLCAVTHQAVSKWENGMALPDMQTLLFLSKLFQVSMEDILTGQASPAPAEAAAKADEPAASVAQAAAGAAVREEAPEPPQEREAAASSPEAAPPDAAQFKDDADPEIPDMAWEEIQGLAPFASTAMLDQMVKKQVARDGGTVPWKRISGLLPFLSEGTIELLFSRFSGESDASVDTQALVALAPFVSREFLGRAVRQMEDRVDASLALKTLAPFLPQDMVDELIRIRMKQGRNAAPVPKAADTVPVREAEPGNSPDWGCLIAQAPMLDMHKLDSLLLEQLRRHGARGLSWDMAFALFPFAGEKACNALAQALVRDVGKPQPRQRNAFLPFVDDGIFEGEAEAQKEADADAGKERLLMRIARKAVDEGNEEWLEENAEALNQEEAAVIGPLAAKKGMWDVVLALWQQADDGAKKRVLDNAIHSGKWDLLEEFIEEADEATAGHIAEAAVQAQKWDLLEELIEHVDSTTLRHIAEAAVQAQKWDLLEGLSDHADNDTLHLILEAAIDHSQWDLIDSVRARL